MGRNGRLRDLLMNFSPAARVGVVIGVIAAAVGAWAAIAEGGLAGAILVAVLLGVLVGGFWIGLAPQARRNRLARVGVAAEATTKTYINRFEMPAYQPGVRLPVVVDPKDPTRVAVA